MNPNDQIGLILALLSMRDQMPSTTDPQPMPQDPYTDWSIEFPTDANSRYTRGAARREAALTGLSQMVDKVRDPRRDWRSMGEMYGRGSILTSPDEEWKRAYLESLLHRLSPTMSVAVPPEVRNQRFRWLDNGDG